MIRITSLVLAAWALHASTPQDEKADATDTRSVAEEYVDANFQGGDLERAVEFLAEDALFVDPTAKVFGGPLAEGLRGRQAILELQRSWGTRDTGFDIEHAFVAGEYAVNAGQYSYTTQGGVRLEGIPFATILRVEEGLITKRLDYGDYRKIVQAPEVEPELEQVAEAYLDAYFGRRFEDLAAMTAEDATFQDPTAVMIDSGQVVLGRAAIRANFEQALAGALSFSFERKYGFAFQSHALFAGTCSFSYPGQALGLAVERADFTIPILVVLEVRDGLVVEHRDFADYAAYGEQLRALQK